MWIRSSEKDVSVITYKYGSVGKILTWFVILAWPMRKKRSSKNNLITDLRTVHQQIKQQLSRSLREALLKIAGNIHTPLLYSNRNRYEVLIRVRSLG
jgi:hypothetical protein